jgi:hypothetical protein
MHFLKDSNSIDDLFGPIVSAAPNTQSQQGQLFVPHQSSNLQFSQSSPNFNNVNTDLFSRVFSGTEQVNVGNDQRRLFKFNLKNIFLGLTVQILINYQTIL